MSLISLSEIKTFLKITSETSDALLNDLISKASWFLVQECNRSFESTVYEQVYSGKGDDELMLDNYPLISVSKLSEDFDVETKTINEEIDLNLILLDKKNGILVYPGYTFPEGKRNVYVKYTAGYAVIPDSIKLVCYNLVAKKFYDSDQKRFGINAKTVMGETINFDTSDLSQSDKDMIDKIRKIPRSEGVDITIT